MSEKHNPNYYKAGASDALAFVMAAGLDYPSGCIVKYLCRCGKKPGESRLDDLQKAKVYLDRMIEEEEIRVMCGMVDDRIDGLIAEITPPDEPRVPILPRKQKRGREKK